MSRVETIGSATLYLGDFRDILPTLGRADALVTDPPYGIGFPYLSYEDSRENLRGLISALFNSREQFDRAAILCGPSQIHEYPPPDWVGAVTWNTTGSFGKFGYSQWTPVLLYGQDIAGFGNVNGITKSDVYHINGGGAVGFQRSKEEAKHTCPKPLNIMLQTVQRYTPAGGIVVDPFMGSGTTGVAAINLDRKFIGIEIEPKYFDISCRRIEEEAARPRLAFDEPEPHMQTAMFDD